MKKNVLFVIDSLTCGGAEKSLVSLLPLLNRDKYDLYLWIRSRGGVFESLLPSDVIIVEPPEYSFKEKLLKIIAQIGFSICIRWNHLTRKKVHGAELLWQCMGKTIKVPDGHWDAVVAYQQGIPTYLVASHFDGSKKLAWVNVDISSAGYNSKFNTKFYSKYNNIIAVSDSLKCMLDEAMSQFREKYDVVYDIINPEITKQLSAYKERNIKQMSEAFVIVTTARMAVQKRYDLAVESAEILKARGLQFRWYFIGDGPQRQSIESMIKSKDLSENIVLLGFQQNPYQYMDQADIYVQTSEHEGFCMTIREAKILGLPIVSTDFPAIHNQLVNGKNGLIVPINAKSIADAIYLLATDSEMRNRMVAEVAKENYNTYLESVARVESLLDE